MDAGLRADFGENWLTCEGDTATDVLKPEIIEEFLDRNPYCSAVSTHLGRPRSRAHILSITLLPPPCSERVRCMPSRAARHSQPNHKRAQGNFSDYVAWALDSEDGGVVIRDY